MGKVSTGENLFIIIREQSINLFSPNSWMWSEKLPEFLVQFWLLNINFEQYFSNDLCRGPASKSSGYLLSADSQMWLHPLLNQPMNLHITFLKNILLEYSWLTMLCKFQVQSKVNQLYIYMCPLFFRFFSHTGHYRILSWFPCAIQ